MLDDRDRTLLSLLQADADMPIAELARRVALSASACSRRIARLREEGYIARQVALLDRKRMNLPTTVFVMVRTGAHAADWQERFTRAIAAIPEIVEVHRLTGEVDYLLKLVLPTVEHYDIIYKRLTLQLAFQDVSAAISMETLKSGTGVPTSYA